MDLDVVFLGTAGSTPTPRRGLPAVLVRHGGDRILVDCGEGTQRQLMRSVGLVELDLVWITHGHADHVLGLPGMLKSFSLRDRSQPLTIVGPRGFDRLYGDMERVFGRLSFDVEVLELEPGDQLDTEHATLSAVRTNHGGARSIGFRLAEPDRPGRFDIAAARALGVPDGPEFGRLQRGEAVEGSDGTVTPDMVLGEARKGRLVVITGDTRPSDDVVEAAFGGDLLVHEATFTEDEQARAVETGHSTALEAAEVAADAEVGLLAITHVSNRYHGRELCDEARTAFPAAACPRDFDLVEVPFREKGSPVLVAAGGRPDRRPAAAATPAPAPVAGGA